MQSIEPGMTSGYFRAALNLVAPAVTHHKAISGHEERMKIALLALLGLALGALGGAALGIGAGLAWVELFKTTSFEGYSSMLVFFTFMPLGAAIGGLGGALLFGVIARRRNRTRTGARAPARPLARQKTTVPAAFVQCKNADCISVKCL